MFFRNQSGAQLKRAQSAPMGPGGSEANVEKPNTILLERMRDGSIEQGRKPKEEEMPEQESMAMSVQDV